MENEKKPDSLGHVVVKIGGASYVGCVTVGSIIKTEKHLGKPMTVAFADPEHIGFAEMATIVRYALHPFSSPDKSLDDDEWDKLLNTPDVVGFAGACKMVMNLLVDGMKKQS